MVFFKPKPNLGDHEKARLEFHLQEIAESIGFERMRLPVLRSDQLRDLQGKTPEEIVAFAGKHLSHSVGGLQVRVAIEPQEKCGGGG
ncbi:hypothetical protein [Mariniblastus fucicola]|uniref:Uncharacterized protein n=1 Tax=Mariniblastus fucicola TaxID=980251 RepID=A0A5B9PHD4_9BACT|nr:hypothetical protein [Mariniblastus fucicola]QEG25019.1 hypothetical protein MFFC18_49420 [Mariniblastus fucicola]